MTDFHVPVKFFDGKRETDLGLIKANQSMRPIEVFTAISQKIGFLDTTQFTLYQILRKKPKSNRKVPITLQSDLGLMLRERDCHFLAEWKKGCRNKKKPTTWQQQQQQQQQILDEQQQSLQKRFLIAPPEKMLLRRDDPTTQQQYAFLSRYSSPIRIPALSPSPSPTMNSLPPGFGFYGYDQAQLRNFQIARAEYERVLGNRNPTYVEIDDDESVNSGGAVCEVCDYGNGKAVPFHLCVHDPTTKAFGSSPAGPIERPSKRKS